MLLRIAWRNLWRHRARTLILGSAVAFSYALLLVSMGVGDDGHRQMLDAARKGAGGDVLVHAEGYWETRLSDAVIRDGDRLLATVEGTEGVAAALPRVIVTGLASTSSGNRLVVLMGIDPARETALQDFSGDVREGVWVDRTEGRNPIVLGAGIAEKLDLQVGDRVVLTATGPDGEIARALFHLRGVLDTGLPEVDDVMGFTTLEAARGAMGMEGMLTQIGVLAEPGLRSDSLKARLEEALRAPEAGLEVLTWQEAVPEMVGFVEVDNAFLYIYAAVIFGVVAFAIANTFLMAVMERIREFGLLAALGLPGRKVAALLLAETVLMTLLAMAVGLTVGYGGHLAIRHWGIPLSAWGVDDVEIAGVDFADMVMRSQIVPGKWIVASVLVAAVTIVSALYPAWRASRLAPAEAMRFYK